MNFTQQEYHKFDKRVNFLVEKLTISNYPTYSEHVYREYTENGKNCTQIADHFGVRKFAIKYQLNKMGAQMRPRGGRNYWKITDEMRNEIISIPKTDKHYSEKFGLHPSTVFRIRKGQV